MEIGNNIIKGDGLFVKIRIFGSFDVKNNIVEYKYNFKRLWGFIKKFNKIGC